MLGALLIVAALADLLSLGVGGRRSGLLAADLGGGVAWPVLARPGKGRTRVHHPEGGCLQKGVWLGADDLRRAIQACWPAASRPGRAVRAANRGRRRAAAGPG